MILSSNTAGLGQHGLCPPDVERSTELSRSLEDLYCVINRYDNLVGALSAKLSPVLRCASPEVCENVKQESYQTDMGNKVNGMRCTLRDITNCLESIYERLEL